MRPRRFLAWVLLCALCGLPFSGAATPAPVLRDEGLRVELPLNGELVVENRRGGVSVEVWDERYVSVSAIVEEFSSPRTKQTGRRAASSAREKSPVRIEKTENLLTINVARAVVANAPRVDLKLRIPAASRAKIFTGDGPLAVRGVPAHLSAQTVSGDINLDIDESPDANLTAHSLNGAVTFKNGAAANPERFDKQKFEKRLGAGERVVRLFSGRGGINITTTELNASEAVVVTNRTSSPVASTPRAYQVGGASQSVSTQTYDSLSGATADAPKPPVLVGAGGSAAGTPAKSSDGPEEVDDEEVVRVDSELVTLNVSVIDRASGRGLLNLAQADFKLYEDKAEQQVAHFEAAAAPFDLVLLIDLSGSTGRVTNVIRTAALSFVNAARPQDRIGVITFASATNIVSPLTTNREALRAAIGAMQPPNGDTKLYDALDFTLDQLSKDGNNTRRRAVVLMSDGLDSTLPNVTGVGSTVTYEDLRARVREFDGVLYALWTSTEYEAFSPLDIQPETFDLVRERMQELAEAGGGVFYDVERLEDLAGTYERVVADLGTVYSLSYRPLNKTRDGRWRAIRITLPHHPNAVARGKRGYYAK